MSNDERKPMPKVYVIVDRKRSEAHGPILGLESAVALSQEVYRKTGKRFYPVRLQADVKFYDDKESSSGSSSSSSDSDSSESKYDHPGQYL